MVSLLNDEKMPDIMNRASGYVKARTDAFTGTINDAANRLKGEGAIGDAIQILVSVGGLLPIDDYGRAAQQRREAARKVLTGY